MQRLSMLVLALTLGALPLYGQDAGISEAVDAPRIATSTSVVPASSVRHGTQYVVKFELFREDAKAETQPLSAPSLLVLEGQEATMAVEGERPLVTGVRKSEGSEEAIVTTFREGHRCKVTVVAIDENSVHLDASLSVSNISGGESATGSTASPTLATRSWRTAQCVELGQPVEVYEESTGSKRLVGRIVVDHPGIEEAAITPISAAEAGESEDMEVYTAVYAVDDLLEQYAQDLPTEDLKATDFVLLTEKLRKQAGIEWPEGCSMRPFPANRSLVISQTRAGHEKISDLLDEKRTNVADARKLLTR